MTGKTYTSFRKNERKQRPFRLIKIGLTRPREVIYQRINERVDQMMADGLLEEARSLYPQRSLNALNTVGYKEMFTYLDGTWTLDEAIERMKGNTRRYARKQLTWFKRDPEVEWFSPDDKELIINHIENNG
jgi:tRNA dimethylallyltransferase